MQNNLIAKRGQVECASVHRIVDDRHGKPTITVETSSSRERSRRLIQFLLVILRQAFLEVLGAEGIQRRVIACPASRREMRAASQAFTATGGPQVGSGGGAIVTETVPSRTVNRSSSLRPSALQALLAHGTARERRLDSVLAKYRVDPLERARFGEHLHQFRQRVFRLDMLRDAGDVRGAVGFARRKNRQQAEEEREHAPAGEHCA